MNTRRLSIHLISVLLVLLWGGILLYFYLSQRLVPYYLQPLGNFRNMVLYSGIGLVVLGIFNLATLGAEDADCCGHGHTHDKEEGHEHDCCAHEHHHEHHHPEPKQHEHVHGEAHGHGILEDSGSVGRTFAILTLAVPMLVAATFTPDKPSAAWVQKKGLYNQQYGVGTRAEQYSLRKGEGKTEEIVQNALPEVATSPASTPDSQRTPGSAAGSSGATPTATTTTASSSAAKSFGSFTLADLKQQVPQNKEGDFILEVPELYYTAGDKEVQGVLKGQPVITTAQVLPEKVNNTDGKRIRIFRLLVQCCAADAKPYSIPVEFSEKAPDLKEMSWQEIRGTMDYVQENGQTVPLLRVTSSKEAAAPTDAMLY